MPESKLMHPYPAVVDNGRLHYGGSQLLSDSKTIRDCGCGLIAACDLFLYLTRYHSHCNCSLFSSLKAEQPIRLSDYNSCLSAIRSIFPLIPHFGINGFLLSAGINRFFHRYQFPYRAQWAIRNDLLWPRVEEMLRNDIPVIISVGPNLPLFWNKHTACLYRSSPSGEKVAAASVTAHYMTITAMDDEWITVASWGRQYYMHRREYEEYVRAHSMSLVSNIVYIHKR